MLATFALVALSARSPAWVCAPTFRQGGEFIAIGLVVTITVEIIATPSNGVFSWRYAPAIPVTPVFGVGLVPILMWLIVPLLVLWFVDRQITGSMDLLTVAAPHRAQSD